MIEVYTLWLRQIKRYYRSKSRIVGSLGQPLLFMLALGFGFGPIFQKAGAGNYMQFLVPGIISMSILFMAFSSGIEVIWDRQFGFLKETLVAPASHFQIMLGKTLGGATVAVLQGFIVFLLSFFVGFRPPDAAMLALAFVFMFLIALLFAALGIAIASVLEDMHGFQLIMNFLVMPIFFLSGALFPISSSLPKAITIITAVDPLSYGVDGLRGTLASASHYGLFPDFLILICICAVLIAIGSYLFSKIQV
jgi:ABC-2 type transport system permease protein